MSEGRKSGQGESKCQRSPECSERGSLESGQVWGLPLEERASKGLHARVRHAQTCLAEASWEQCGVWVKEKEPENTGPLGRSCINSQLRGSGLRRGQGRDRTDATDRTRLSQGHELHHFYHVGDPLHFRI